MASLINKVKETLTGATHSDDVHHDTTTHHNPTSTITDTHHTGQHPLGETGAHTGTTGYGNTTAGPHNSNLANKMDPRIDSDRDGSNRFGTGYGHNTHKTTVGPHSSDVANKIDPRVDSDRDGSTRVGAGTGTGYGGHGTTGYGTKTTAGPHDSNIANKLDPTVDSDRDGSRTVGGTRTGTGGGLLGAGTGLGHNTTTTAGPHNSNVANRLDPTVDSDRDGSHNLGGNRAGHGHTGTGIGTGLGSGLGHHTTTGTGLGHNTTTTSGPHNSKIANKLDPMVDSDRDGSHIGGTTHSSSHVAPLGVTSHGKHQPALNVGGASSAVHEYTSGTHTHGTTGTHGTHGTHETHGTHNLPGPAPTTAGPHKSDILNKLDPRVDSDLDGSKTYGGDKTYAGREL